MIESSFCQTGCVGQVAIFLHGPVDEEVQETELNAEELSLIQKYRSLPASSRQVLQQLTDDMLHHLSS